MSDGDRGVGGASAETRALEWAFSLLVKGSPWSVEQGMTQLLAYENAEGFTLPLTDAVQADARAIHELGQRRTPTAVAVLRAFQAMSTIDTQRELARVNADRLVRQGLPDPSWAATIGRVRVDGCWWAHDQFDETAVVLCTFSYDGADEHGILAMINRIVDGGLIKELLLGTCPDRWLDTLHRSDGGDDDFVVEPLDPASARRLLEDAVATSDRMIEQQPDMSRLMPMAYRKMRALTLARARALSDVAAPPEPLPGGVEIELLKQSFLASTAASGLPTDEATRQAVDLLVAQFTDQAVCHPLHLGPRRVQAVLSLPALSADQIDDPDVARILPDVARAWISWTATERGLHGDAAQRLERAAREACLRLGSARTRDDGTT